MISEEMEEMRKLTKLVGQTIYSSSLLSPVGCFIFGPVKVPLGLHEPRRILVHDKFGFNEPLQIPC